MEAILRRLVGPTGETNYLVITSVAAILILYLASSTKDAQSRTPPFTCVKSKHDIRFSDGQSMGDFCHSSFLLTPDYDLNSTYTIPYMNSTMGNYDFLK